MLIFSLTINRFRLSSVLVWLGKFRTESKRLSNSFAITQSSFNVCFTKRNEKRLPAALSGHAQIDRFHVFTSAAYGDRNRSENDNDALFGLLSARVDDTVDWWQVRTFVSEVITRRNHDVTKQTQVIAPINAFATNLQIRRSTTWSGGDHVNWG